MQHRWGSPSGEWIESAVQDAMKLLDTPGLRERMRELNLVVNSPDIRATMENVARMGRELNTPAIRETLKRLPKPPVDEE